MNGTLWKEEASTWLEKSIRAHLDTEVQRARCIQDAIAHLESSLTIVMRDIASCQESLDVIKSVS